MRSDWPSSSRTVPAPANIIGCPQLGQFRGIGLDNSGALTGADSQLLSGDIATASVRGGSHFLQRWSPDARSRVPTLDLVGESKIRPHPVGCLGELAVSVGKCGRDVVHCRPLWKDVGKSSWINTTAHSMRVASNAERPTWPSTAQRSSRRRRRLPAPLRHLQTSRNSQHLR